MTTTAELVDVFASKREGVLYVLEAARNALPGRRAAGCIAFVHAHLCARS